MTKTKEDKIQEDKKEEGDSAKTPVVNLWSAEFMAKNKAHQAKVQKIQDMCYIFEKQRFQGYQI